jgi:hypothetical protein
MGTNPITGHSLRFKFADGPMAGRSFDHTFNRNGQVTFREVGGDPNAKPDRRISIKSLHSGRMFMSFLT